MFNIPTQVTRFHRWKNWKRWCPKLWKQLRTVPGQNFFWIVQTEIKYVYTILSGQWRVYATSIGLLFNCCWFWYWWWLRNPVFTKCVIYMKPSEKWQTWTIHINWCFPTIWDLWNLLKNGHILYITWSCCRVSEPPVGPALGDIIDMKINMKLMGFIWFYRMSMSRNIFTKALNIIQFIWFHRISSTDIGISKSWAKMS